VAAGKPPDRSQLKAQMSQLRKIEKEMTALNDAREHLERQLSEASLYDAANLDDLKAHLAAQAKNSKRLEQVEEEWLRLSEAMERQSG
jgi:ATP-binding cassette subfamily F protein 3